MSRTFLLLSGLLLACGSTAPSELWQAELDAARLRWATNGLSEYEYTYTFQCGFCPPDARRHSRANP